MDVVRVLPAVQLVPIMVGARPWAQEMICHPRKTGYLAIIMLSRIPDRRHIEIQKHGREKEGGAR